MRSECLHNAGAAKTGPAPIRAARYRDQCGKMWLVFLAPLRYHVPMNNESIDNIASRLAEAVPEGLKSVREDLEQNFRGVLRASLSKLDLVTREEFEVQEAVLAKTRAKLEALEKKLEALEIGAKAPPTS